MMGSQFGVPFHTQLQREIILAALSRTLNARKSGDIYHFPKTWAEARMEGKEIERQRNRIE
jgi:hypothetical protein